MFVAVSFLSLTNTQMDKDILPKGKKAVLQTAVGTHLLALVINMSVLFVFGDRLQKNGTLNKSQQIILARSFCAAAWWSPFFIATGVAMTYAPGMSWYKTLIPGIFMSIVAISYSVVEVCYFRKEEFSGYPFKKESMRVPVSLAVLVVIVHCLRPEASILNIICLLSPVGAIGLMTHRPRREMVRRFINTSLISMGSQFTLFLSAWAISTGSSPLAGVGLALVSRYRASSGGILRCNWHYAVMMWAFASGVNLVFFVR